MHKPIQIKDLSVSFSHKTCFENFNCQVVYGHRIAIIGRNGSGKSTLLNILAGIADSSNGIIHIGKDVVLSHVPQVIENHITLSGGQRMNAALTEVLSLKPNILLLDEPTNHLDRKSRKGLLRMLKSYTGTLIVVTHDTELLRNCIDTLWHIDNGTIHIFSGNYDDYIREIKQKSAALEHALARLTKQKKDLHNKLMAEQQRTAKSKSKGEKNIANRKWMKMSADKKVMNAEKSQGKKLREMDETKDGLVHQLAELRLPETIAPKFIIDSDNNKDRTLIQIADGAVGYFPDQPLISNINLILCKKDRVALVGDNGSGKSTLVNAMLDDETIYKTGDWFLPRRADIGYLEQHYNTLNPNTSVFEAIAEITPHWSNNDIRCHLNDFLFRKNEEVNTTISTLSGGEKARLILAQIAAKPPKLLVLDEITNNFDLETKGHIAQVLKAYPGAIIAISNDIDFLKEIGTDSYYNINNGCLGLHTP